ncbi:biotin synthase BioB [Candidatus Poribacteria bacterium]|nr:biotin synthase BioB [Candidatus Poribacteria bacterium]
MNFTQAGETVWNDLADRILAGGAITREEALEALRSPDSEVLALLAAAYRVRHHHFGNRVQLHRLMNAQSGLCPEDCHYCSQSKISNADITKYPMRSREEILDGARRAFEMKSCTYCIVTSGRGPTDKQVEFIAGVVRGIKSEMDIKVCCCMGLLKPAQAEVLHAAGVDRYNHNLNTSARHSPEIVSTHTYQDRLGTASCVKDAGISLCSGAIFGMGETDEDIVDVAFALNALGPVSIPVNFLHPIEGTPLRGRRELAPVQCLRILAVMRLINPDREIRVAGGREVNLRSLQPLGLYAANSIFLGDYLTTEGQSAEADYAMIEDLGFVVEAG